jgi:hypothetical protein
MLSCRYRAGMLGDVPLPRVDVRRPWRCGPIVVAGGSSGGRGGVARVTAMSATIAVLATAIAVVAVVVLVLVVVVGWLGQRIRLQLRSRRHSVGVERCRSSRWPSGVYVDHLQKEVKVNFKKVQERRGAPNDGPKVLDALVKTAKDVADEDPVANG